jgi:guanylate kinase
MSTRRHRNSNYCTRSIIFLVLVAVTIVAAIFCGSCIVLQSADAFSFVTTTNYYSNKQIGCNNMMFTKRILQQRLSSRSGAMNSSVIKKYSIIQRNMILTPSTDAPLSTSASTTTSHHRQTLQPLVVCGPSGVGKGTIISRFMEMVNGKTNRDGSSSSSTSSSANELHHHLPEFKFSVSHTTRFPRDGEIHGVHYHFVTKEFMLSKINNTTRSSSNDGNNQDGTNSNNNFFVEYAQVHGNLYGTSFQSIYDASSSSSVSKTKHGDGDQRRKRECLLDIDVKGVRSIKEFQLRQRREIKDMTTPPIRLGKERSTQQYIVGSPLPSVTGNKDSIDISQSSTQQLPLLDPKYIFITPPSIETLRERLSNRNTETPQSLELRLRNAQEEMEYGLTIGNFDAVIVNDDLDRACDEFVKVVAGLYTNK